MTENWTPEQLHAHLQQLQAQITHLREENAQLQQARQQNQTPNFMAMIEEMRAQLAALQVRKSAPARATTETDKGHDPKPPKLPLPDKYTGVRKAEVIDEFMDQTRRYLKVYNVTDDHTAIG